MVYHVYPDPDCPEQGPCNLKIDVAWEESQWRKDEKGKEDGAAKTDQPEKENRSDLLARAAKENDRLNPWVFVVPKWRHDAFITDLQGLTQAGEGRRKAGIRI